MILETYRAVEVEPYKSLCRRLDAACTCCFTGGGIQLVQGVSDGTAHRDNDTMYLKVTSLARCRIGVERLGRSR